MTFAPEVAEKLAEWHQRKRAQWDRVKTRLVGLQLARSGPDRSQYMITYSTDEFYESVIFGQLPQLEWEKYGQGRAAQARLVPEARRLSEKRSIDFTDDQLDTVIEAWADGKSAGKVPFVKAIFGRDGRMLTKQ